MVPDPFPQAKPFLPVNNLKGHPFTGDLKGHRGFILAEILKLNHIHPSSAELLKLAHKTQKLP